MRETVKSAYIPGNRDNMPEVIYGINPVLEALKARSKTFNEVIIARPVGKTGGKIHGKVDEILKMCRESGIKTTFKDRDVLTDLIRNNHHQGIVAILRRYRYAGVEEIINLYRDRKETALIVIADGIEDPQNLGALIRSAHAGGAHGVLIPKHGAAPVTASVDKASAGALEHILVARVVNIVATIKDFRRNGIWIVGMDADARSTIYHVDLTENVAVIVGGEGRGIRPLVRKHCDFLASLPMKGKVSSLNAAIAGSIALYEAVRQRQQKL